MNKVILTSVLLAASMAVSAQDIADDGSIVELPVEAQQCDLPSAPAPLPEVPVKADLLKAQKEVKKFQADMVVYRECINKDAENPDLSGGNVVAISNAHNYSVDMEERVANWFNEAIRAYKAAQAKK